MIDNHRETFPKKVRPPVSECDGNSSTFFQRRRAMHCPCLYRWLKYAIMSRSDFDSSFFDGWARNAPTAISLASIRTKTHDRSLENSTREPTSVNVWCGRTQYHARYPRPFWNLAELQNLYGWSQRVVPLLRRNSERNAVRNSSHLKRNGDLKTERRPFDARGGW